MPTPSPSCSSHPWVDPLALTAGLDRECAPLVLLYSGMRTSYSGRYSWLAWQVEEVIEADDFTVFEQAMARAPDARWFGWLGYELAHALEELPATAPPPRILPALKIMRFAHLLRFDHEAREIAYLGDDPHFKMPEVGAPVADTAPPPISSLASNMSKAAYLEAVAETLEHIRAGQVYQANITRKFYGEFAEVPDAFALFCRLCAASPAPYSAYLSDGAACVLSSSPELFLRVGSDGAMTARPIKGSLGKHAGVTAEQLAKSSKDRAENLMIVDLMRNDFSRVAIPGSVGVEGLYDIDSFATIHHMASTVTGRLAESYTPLEAIKACFPPGSMTGAPKIAAMRWIAAMEGMQRGVYSGALGWLSAGSCELSVVIRTLLLQNKCFEFQVGGGIVADSTPQSEWRETLDKARGIATALGIPRRELERL